ncbi:MAG: hypothetical protein CMO55_16135 [Verrucomicrobiales bacterium]|nr:hypothetical protein [Verrucomicrobiales bacterium]
MSSSFSRILIGLATLAALMVAAVVGLSFYLKEPRLEELPPSNLGATEIQQLETVNQIFADHWKSENLSPTPEADTLTLVRRLSLALTGAAPSLEEIRRLKSLTEDADPIQSWLTHLFSDQRYSNYIAERLARTYVGVEQGPFLVYRRRRMVNWLAEELVRNRPYDELVRDMVAAEGIWTSNPEANFITVSVIQNGENKGPDEVKLAARTSRAFLGVSLDCMQCHDDKFGDHWKQQDFHQLAAFFAQSDMAVSGVIENRKKVYQTRYNGETEESKVPALVPYSPELLPESGNYRQRLAQWITHRENRAFSRAMVNRTWALITGRPLSSPVDDIPLEGPFPVGMEEFVDAFIESDFDLQSLIRIMAASEPFRRSSSTGDPEAPVTLEQEEAWAAFPITPLRPEQVAGSVIQAGTLTALDGNTHIFQKIRRFGETRDFVKRYGDPGENEFIEDAGTIPQRLLLMNGKLVDERTEPNPLMNSSTRLAHHSPSDEAAVDVAFLATLTRHPNEEESRHFVSLIDGTKSKHREKMMEDVYWALINSTEFSWNR